MRSKDGQITTYLIRQLNGRDYVIYSTHINKKVFKTKVKRDHKGEYATFTFRRGKKRVSTRKVYLHELHGDNI